MWLQLYKKDPNQNTWFFKRKSNFKLKAKQNSFFLDNLLEVFMEKQRSYQTISIQSAINNFSTCLLIKRGKIPNLLNCKFGYEENVSVVWNFLVVIKDCSCHSYKEFYKKTLTLAFCIFDDQIILQCIQVIWDGNHHLFWCKFL